LLKRISFRLVGRPHSFYAENETGVPIPDGSVVHSTRVQSSAKVENAHLRVA
jgi:hypothetical protein